MVSHHIFQKSAPTALDKPSFECLQTRKKIRTKDYSQRPLFLWPMIGNCHIPSWPMPSRKQRKEQNNLPVKTS